MVDERMSDYLVVYRGEVRAGCEEAEVRRRMAALFKKSEAQIAALFTGQRVVVKCGLTLKKAEQYCQAMAQVGAVASVEQQQAKAESTSRDQGLDVGRIIAARVNHQAMGELSDVEIAPLGATLDQTEPVPVQAVDVSHLALIDSKG
ncbi:MAG: hypothetical protein P8176_11720 [Gammaproteobacteria bacterium]|jgi:hypothetical protein